MKWERTVTVIGCHVGGEDNHVIVGGVLPAAGATMSTRSATSRPGSQFDSTILAEVTVGGRPAIVPIIGGQAWITGVFQHGSDPSDPFRHGFTLPDMWFS